MYDFANQDPRGNVQGGGAWPVWNRNEGGILAAQGKLAQAEAAIGQARARARERLTAAYQKYRNARRQMDLAEQHILPDARTVVEQVEKVYEVQRTKTLPASGPARSTTPRRWATQQAT